MLGGQLASPTLGDAGAAVIVERAESPTDRISVVGFATLAEHSRLCLGAPSRVGPGASMFTKARSIHAAAIEDSPPLLREALETAGLGFGEIDWVIPHQTSVRAIETGASAPSSSGSDSSPSATKHDSLSAKGGSVNRSSVVSALAVALLAGSCGTSGPSIGHEGRVQLTYLDAWDTCTHDCSLDVPLGVGADALVEVANADDLPDLTGRSSDPAVLEVYETPSARILRLRGVAAGMAELELSDAAGTAIDSFTVEVHPIARVVLTSSVTSPIRVVDAPVELIFDTFDASGARLRGFGGVSYEPTPNLAFERVNLADRLASLTGGFERSTGSNGVNGEDIFVTGDLSASVGTLLAHPTVGAPLELTFDVVGPIVESITLGRRFADDGWFVVAWIARSNPEVDIHACCEWDLDPSDPTLFLTERECTQVRVGTTDTTLPQSATVWCRSRGVEASIDVELPPP